MLNPHEKEIENTKVKVRCPDRQITFHERLNRVSHADVVTCPSFPEKLHFHGIGHIHELDSVADYIRHVEERTARQHFCAIRHPVDKRPCPLVVLITAR